MKRARQQDAAIAALVQHQDVTKAAAALGIRARTLAGWLENPEFGAAYRQRLSLSFDAALARLQLLADQAVTTLAAVMKDGSGKGAMARVAAATRTVELARLGSNAALLRRVQAIERAIADRKTVLSGGKVTEIRR